MALTQLEAKTQIARVDGGQNDSDQLSAAEDALSYVIDRWNRQNWNWLLRDNSSDPDDIVSGTSDYEVPTGARVNGIHSVRLISRNRTLIATDPRAVDRIVRDQSTSGLTTHYIIYESTAFDPSDDDSQAGVIRLIRTPDYTQADDLLIRYYEHIDLPGDANEIKIPDQCRDVLVAMGRGRYLMEKNAESTKARSWATIAEQLYQEMKESDRGHQNEDQDIRLRSGSEQGYAYGSDLTQDYWSN